MRLQLQVVKVEREQYESKSKGHVDQQVVIGVDADEGGVEGLFKFVPDDQKKLPKFGDVLSVIVRRLYAQNGGFRVTGNIVQS